MSLLGIMASVVYLVGGAAAAAVAWRTSRSLGLSRAERVLAALYLAVAWPGYLVAGLGLALGVVLVRRGRPTLTHTSPRTWLAQLLGCDPRS